MARFPKAEADVTTLAMAMVAGYTTHAADFPSADAAGLSVVYNAYLAAKSAQTDAMAAAQVATETKDAALDALEDVMKAEPVSYTHLRAHET